VKFGFSGDADGRFRPYHSIANLTAQKLDFFVFLGDAMYETASTGFAGRSADRRADH
jgi:phosphodiesterase/alkaline phosphatase D-like protein